MQRLLHSGWLAIWVMVGLGGCDKGDAYTVLTIDNSMAQVNAHALRVDATVGSLSAEEVYAGMPDAVGFWLPLGTLYFDTTQGQWIGEEVAVTVEALDGNGCVLASGKANMQALYQRRLDLMVSLIAQGSCTL